MTTAYSPLKSIHIKNFQSIEDATIMLGRLTVLVGPGDVGKSAALRALRAATLNEGDDADIRHGASRCEVELSFEDGMSITWWKDRRKGGCYRMGYSREESTEYTKTGGVVPDAVAEWLGVGLIEIDATTELTPQLSDQHDPPFIIWETGSKRARILGKATRLDMVVSAQMQCTKELAQAHRGVEEATTSLATVEEQLAALPNYKAIIGELNEAEANLKTIDDNILLADRVRELAGQIAEVRSRATVIDTTSLRKRLDATVEPLERAFHIQSLAGRIPELLKTIADLDGRITNHQVACTSFQEQLATACKEAGACITCGGLLSHKECTS